MQCVSGRQHSVSALRASRSCSPSGGLPAHSTGARRSRARAGCGAAPPRRARPPDGHATMRIRRPRPGSDRTRSVCAAAGADFLESGPVTNKASANTKGWGAGGGTDSGLRHGLRPSGSGPVCRSRAASATLPTSPDAPPPPHRGASAARPGRGRGPCRPGRTAAAGRLKPWKSRSSRVGREGSGAPRRPPPAVTDGDLRHR